MSEEHQKHEKLNLGNRSHESLQSLAEEIRQQFEEGTLNGDMIAYKTNGMTTAELTAFYDLLAEQGLGNLSAVAGDVASLEQEFRKMHGAQESWIGFR